MDLTWHRGYEDYDDPGWPARKDYLTQIWQSLSPEKADRMGMAQLMDYLELLEELMRYYTVKLDFRNLEPLMRNYEPLMDLLRAQNPDNAGYWYLEMEYARVNAMLYLNQGSNQQASHYYSQALAYGDCCFSRLQAEAGSYKEEQRLYLSWSCAECRNEMAVACERILDTAQMYQSLTGALPILQYAEGCLGDADGICEKIAELYSRTGSIYYQYNEFEKGSSCYKHSIDLFNWLADKLDSDFYRARALWIYGMYGIDSFTRRADADVMLACENELTRFLNSGAAGISRSIAEGAQAMNYMQRGTAIQQSGGNITDAIQWTEKSVNLFGNAQEALEKDIQDIENAAARNTISDIAARLYSSSIAAMDVLGVQYYSAGQSDEAQSLFEEVLSMLTDTGGYTISESASLLIRAESCQYLALIATENGDHHKVDFYGMQALDFSEESARKTKNPAAWQIVIISASLVSEVAGLMKNKQKMGTLAARGLAACDELAKLMPDHGILAMRANLEKRQKKAQRRFF